MITRLNIDGFKNLVETEIYFGPFTCIAGPNGVGKSNIFDAIMFLSALADHSLLEAAQSIRGEQGRGADIGGLFNRSGKRTAQKMCFDVDMIVPTEAVDHLGQRARATTTFLNYKVVIAKSQSGEEGVPLGLRIVSEDLTYISKGDAARRLLFKPSRAWRDSLIKGRRTTPYISTSEGFVKLHQDTGAAGRAWKFSRDSLPRTVLSSVTAQESPTALVAKNEMKSWRQIQLEPSKLRAPDDFQSPTSIGADGAHLPSTLHHLASSLPRTGEWLDASAVFCELANRLSELIDDVTDIFVDRDEKRELYTVMVAGKDGVRHPARFLSDGTLRFLALAVMQLDPQSVSVLCLEEPENGIHPERIESMLELIGDLVSDVNLPVDSTNPLRQVIINTHSPTVVAQCSEDNILFTEKRVVHRNGERLSAIAICAVDKTWRASLNGGTTIVSKGDICRFLVPTRPGAGSSQRLIDRPDLRQRLELDFNSAKGLK